MFNTIGTKKKIKQTTKWNQHTFFQKPRLAAFLLYLLLSLMTSSIIEKTSKQKDLRITVFKWLRTTKLPSLWKISTVKIWLKQWQQKYSWNISYIFFLIIYWYLEIKKKSQFSKFILNTYHAELNNGLQMTRIRSLFSFSHHLCLLYNLAQDESGVFQDNWDISVFKTNTLHGKKKKMSLWNLHSTDGEYKMHIIK